MDTLHWLCIKGNNALTGRQRHATATIVLALATLGKLTTKVSI